MSVDHWTAIAFPLVPLTIVLIWLIINQMDPAVRARGINAETRNKIIVALLLISFLCWVGYEVGNRDDNTGKVLYWVLIAMYIVILFTWARLGTYSKWLQMMLAVITLLLMSFLTYLSLKKEEGL